MTEPSKAVFLSYASQDLEAAKHICDTLKAAGIEVWFDQSELRGGDVWDHKIRKQIHDCALFIPIISAYTQARAEGYFRLEWRLADQRTHLMGRSRTFLVPVCIDGTPDADADAPDSFLAVQWTRLPSGETPPAFATRVSQLLLLSQHGVSGHAQESTGSPASSRAPQTSARASEASKLLPLLIAAVSVIGVGYLVVDKLLLSKHPSTAVHSPTSTNQSTTAAKPVIPEKSIAVMPFVDLSEKHDQEYFADGMAVELIDLLSQVPEVRVIARASSFQLNGKIQNLRAVAASLGVAFVVEGSVRRSGERIRVTAQLIGTQDGAQRWSESYDREAGDVLKVEQEIATGIVRELQVAVGVHHWFPAPALTSAESYDLYLRGQHAYGRYDRIGFEEAANDFQRVLELDPTSTRAAEALALTHMDQAAFGLVESRPGFELARRDAEYVLKLDPRSEMGHGVLARIHTAFDWDWPAARREAAEALAISPRHPQALWAAASVAASQGQWGDAERLYRASLNVDPLSADTHYELALTLYRSGRLAAAETEARRGLEISPSYVSGHATLATILLAKGEPDAALREMQQEVGEGGQLTGVAIIYYALGRKSESDAALKRATRDTADSDAYGIATVHAFRTEIDQAFQWIDRAFLQKDSDLVYIKGDRLLKNLEPDPRYKAFLRKMNLPE